MSIKVNKENIPTKLSAEKAKPQESDLKYIPDPYKKIAKGMEKQFAEFMISQMEKSTGSKAKDSASQYYKSLMTSERAEVMASKDQGMGLQQVILDQIYPKWKRTPLSYNNYLKQIESQVIRRNNIEIPESRPIQEEAANE